MTNSSTPVGTISTVVMPSSPNPLNVPKEPLVKRVLPWVSICGVVITLATFFLNANLRRRELTFTYLGAKSLIHVERKGLDSTLSIRYGNTPIHELYKLDFLIPNSRSAAIKDEDIKEPLQISFPQGFTLINTPLIEETRPQFTAHLEKITSNKNALLLTFPLPNPGDELKLSIDSLYLGNGAPTLAGRIVDVKQITNVDSSNSRLDTHAVLPFVQSPTLRHAIFRSLLVFNAIVGGFFISLLGVQVPKFLRYKIWHRNWSQRAQLKELGVPTKPDSEMAEDLGRFFSMTGVLLPLAIVSCGNFAYILTGPSV